MLLVWTGVVLLLLRLLGIEPVSGWSWLTVLSPFLLALLWFELVCPMLGLDRAADPRHGAERARRRRIQHLFGRATRAVSKSDAR
jgi:small Trp-rich protein